MGPFGDARDRLPAPGVRGLAAVGAIAAAALAIGGCGAARPAPTTTLEAASSTTHAAVAKRSAARAVASRTYVGVAKRPAARALAPLRLLVTAPAQASSAWTAVARTGATPVAWLAQRGAVTLMRFDQRYVHLDLHAGSLDGGASGWTYGDRIGATEIHRVLAAFNGGFKLTYTDTAFMSGGIVAKQLRRGLASIVTYTDGTTNIGTWGNGVPSVRRAVFSVLQNQHLLVDHGAPADNLATCVLVCWGGTIKDLTVIARSGLGITAQGQIVWAAGEQLSPSSLAGALIGAGAVRAIELDINPAWVAGYLYTHHPSGPVAVGVVPGMRGIAGVLLLPYTRDFLTVVANRARSGSTAAATSTS